MIPYNPNFLENTEIFTNDEIIMLNELNEQLSLKDFILNKSYVDKFGLDFIYTSAKIEGNSYDKLETLALIDYGRTAGGKRYSDAKMILNLREAYDKVLREDLGINIITLKDLHYILSSEMLLESQRATPRTKEVAIKGSEYVPLANKERLDEELKYLFHKANSISNSFNKALYIHNNLAYLQYFTDCNKRTSRTMLNVSLKKDNKMIYIPKETDIQLYLSSMIYYYETGEYSKFKEHFIKSYKDVANRVNQINTFKKNEKASPKRR